MKRVKIQALAISALALAPAAILAKPDTTKDMKDTAVLVVDTSKVIESCSMGRKKMDELDQKRKAILDSMEPGRQALAAKEAELADKGATVSEPTRKKMEADTRLRVSKNASDLLQWHR